MQAAIALFALLVGGCSREQASSSSTAAPKPRLGNVMVEVARRFEIAGRAMNANRFELAEFEVGEIEELFEDDVPNAELPKEGPTAHIPAVAKGFLEANVPELKRAAAAKITRPSQPPFSAQLRCAMHATRRPPKASSRYLPYPARRFPISIRSLRLPRGRSRRGRRRRAPSGWAASARGPGANALCRHWINPSEMDAEAPSRPPRDVFLAF